MTRKREQELRRKILEKLDQDNKLVKNGRIAKGLDDKVASFLTAIYDMGLKPAVSRYSRTEGRLKAKDIMDFIYDVINPDNTGDGKLLEYIADKDGEELKGIKADIVSVGISLKYALRTYPEA